MLKSIQEVSEDLEAGKTLLLAGEETLLRQLPKGKWIGGTIPYFMDDTGGRVSRDQIFVNDITDSVQQVDIRAYTIDQLQHIPIDAADNGFSVLIIPAMSEAHLEYAKNAPNYKDLFMKPILGWIAGVHLDRLSHDTPKVFDGHTGLAFEQKAIVMHCTVENGKTPAIHIVNLFKQGKGHAIHFPELGFQIKEVEINGKTWNFAHYLKEMKTDTRLPLVADYCGAHVNISFQKVDFERGTVDLYAPVFPGVEYRIAEPVGDYVEGFLHALPHNAHPILACNCILNFLYGELEGKKTEGMTGPFTFGEIAYQLVNQTLVYLEIR